MDEPIVAHVFAEDIEDQIHETMKRIGRVVATRDLRAPDPALSRVLAAETRRRAKHGEHSWGFYKPYFNDPTHQKQLRIFNSFARALAPGLRCPPVAKLQYLGVLVESLTVRERSRDDLANGAAAGCVSNFVCEALCDLSTAAGVACDERPTRWTSECRMLRGAFGKAIRIEDRKLIHRDLPIGRRTTPIGRDISQREPDQFGGRIVTREVAAR